MCTVIYIVLLTTKNKLQGSDRIWCESRPQASSPTMCNDHSARSVPV